MNPSNYEKSRSDFSEYVAYYTHFFLVMSVLVYLMVLDMKAYTSIKIVKRLQTRKIFNVKW